MAPSLIPVGEVTLTFVDHDGDIGRTSYNFLASNTAADMQAAAIAIGNAMQAVSGAVLKGVHITYSMSDVNADPAAALAESEVSRKLSLSFEGATPNLKSRVEVPSPLESLFPLGSEYADPTTGGVAALIAAILNPTLGAGTGPVTAGGADLVKFVGRAKEIGRKDR